VLCKNVYNSTIYAIKREYEKTGEYMNFNEANRRFIAENQQDFRKLPSNVATATQKLVHEAWTSFFALIKLYQRGQLEYPPGKPKYLDSVKGRQIAVYTKRVISRKRLLEGFIKLSGIDIEIPLPKYIDPNRVQQIQIVPKVNGIMIETV